MTPDELARIWGLVSEQVLAAERAALAASVQTAESLYEDAGTDFDREAESGFEPSNAEAREDDPPGFRLHWTAKALEAQYLSASSEGAQRKWDPWVAAVVALCNVGGRTEPPRALAHAFVDVVNKCVRPLDFKALLDVATAFGCGWSGDVRSEQGPPTKEEPERHKRGPWDFPWARAETRLSWLIQKRAPKTIGSLSRMGVKFQGPLPGALSAAGVVLHPLVDAVGPIEDRSVRVECRGDETGVRFGQHKASPLRYGARLVLQVVGADAKVWGPPRKKVQYPRPAPAGSRLLVLACVNETRVKCVPPVGDGWELKVSPGEVLVLEPPNARSGVGWRRWACSCGTDQCSDEHRLSSWNPAKQSLDEFIRVAVSGVTTATLKPGQVKQFVSGVLAAIWAAEGLEECGRLVLQPFEYNLCVECALDPQVKDPAFLAQRCAKHVPPRLHRPEDPTVARDRLLLLDTAIPMYDIQLRWACPRSGFLHKEEAVRRVVRPEVFQEVQAMMRNDQRPPSSLVHQLVKERWCGSAGTGGSPCEPCLRRGKSTDRGPKLSSRPTYVWVPMPNAELANMQPQADAADDVGHPLDDDNTDAEADAMQWNPDPASVSLAADLIAGMARRHVSPAAGEEDGEPSEAGPHEQPTADDARDEGNER